MSAFVEIESMKNHIFRGLPVKSLLALSFWGLFATSSQATVIDFEDPNIAANNYFTSSSYNGFDFTSAHAHTIADPTEGTCNNCAANGTQYILSEIATVVTMTQTGGGAFSLQQFDVSEPRTYATILNTSVIQVIATFVGGGTSTESFMLDGILPDGPSGDLADFETFFLSSAFTNLASVTFRGLDIYGDIGGWALDNIVVNTSAVPEPGMLGLFGLSLVLLGFRKRRIA
ncbi:MAG: hypothetical protein COA96_16195 [SAR86 cluster bacterium]|uniref:Ice-binding protein C-terminal domain-containing protein n=1 Tax=SAR86 cluster bacterium TaxID=2030880 RepID=A0A2A5AK48_9GAMM|nr:MAG: hypothetical protein COA96_16195 [SAR86 cluster bacterium]